MLNFFLIIFDLFIYKLPGHWMSYRIVFVHVCFTLSCFQFLGKGFSDVSDTMRYDLITNADHLDVATRMSPVTSRRLNKFPL